MSDFSQKFKLMTYQEHQEQVKTIWDNFNKCTEEEQFVLYLLSMYYKNIKKNDLGDLWIITNKACGGLYQRTAKETIKLVEDLVKKTDLITMVGSEFVVAPMAMNVIFHRAVSYKYYQIFVTAIREERTIRIHYSNQQVYLSTYYHTISDAEREHIIALNSGDDSKINNSHALFEQIRVSANSSKLFFQPFDEAWFSKIPTSLQAIPLIIELSPKQQQLRDVTPYLAMANELPCFQVPEVKARILPYLIYQDAIEGKLDKISNNKAANLTHTGIVAIAKGNFDEAIASGDGIRKAIKGATKKEFYSLSFSSYYILALLIKKNDILAIKKQIESLKKYGEGLPVVMLDLFSNFLLGMTSSRKVDITTTNHSVTHLHIFALVTYWMQQVPNRDELELLEVYVKRAN